MPHIIGDTIYLREYRMEDLEAINRWRNIEEITWWTAVYVWPESLEQTRRFLEDQVNDVDPANRKFAMRNTELGIVLGDPDVLSKGIGTEAINLFLKVCFDELDLHRVGLRVLRANERGMACYKKCGFKEEGVIRDWHHSHGQWHDLVLMGILQDEYRELHQ